MNTFMENLKDANNFGLTENGALTHKTTKSAVLDMFAVCGAYRQHSVEDCILMFKNALEENETLAVKCLFYLGDCRGGQGERRFFRVCFKWLAKNYPEVALRNLQAIPEYRRWDDVIYSTVETPIEDAAFAFIKHQLALDVESKTPSLLAKWMPSENASSRETKRVAGIVRAYLGMTHKQYRKTLSVLRERINIVERLMSENRWDEIEFDKIPSKAGLIYKNAFARRDMIAKKYETFAKSADTKVNAAVLNPVDIAEKVFARKWSIMKDETDRAMLQKYWDNLKDYYNGREENGLAIVDVSGSMSGQPLYAAVSMGAYIAERGHGPFANHFVTFSQSPELVKFEGVDIADKFIRAEKANWEMNTDIKAVFDMLLSVAKNNSTKVEDMPERLYIFSDMQFDRCLTDGTETKDRWGYRNVNHLSAGGMETLLESIASEWAAAGYELPKVVFWNLRASENNIPALGGRFSYVSGFSMSAMEAILSGEDGYSLMLKVLESERYKLVG